MKWKANHRDFSVNLSQEILEHFGLAKQIDLNITFNLRFILKTRCKTIDSENKLSIEEWHDDSFYFCSIFSRVVCIPLLIVCLTKIVCQKSSAIALSRRIASVTISFFSYNEIYTIFNYFSLVIGELCSCSFQYHWRVFRLQLCSKHKISFPKLKFTSGYDIRTRSLLTTSSGSNALKKKSNTHYYIVNGIERWRQDRFFTELFDNQKALITP